MCVRLGGLETIFRAMTIWILALLCVGLAGYAGYSRGVIRAAMSLLGILMGLLLAGALGPLLAPLMRKVINNALLADASAPLIVFLLITFAFKGLAQVVHNKVEVHFKYQETDTKLLHWERLMARMGGGLGVLNGTLYFYVLCAAFYVAGYMTTQITSPENETFGSKIINKVASDINASGMQKAIVAIDPMPQSYYDASDIVGYLHHNPLLISRVSRYPAFLSLAERPEFQEISNDPQVNELIQTHSSVGELLAHPKIKALMANPAIVDGVKALDVADLKAFVETGKSQKYELIQILGRWDFDYNASMDQIRVANPSIRAKQVQSLGLQLSAAFSDSTFTATTDNQAFIKSIPPPPVSQPGQPPQAAPMGPPIRVASGSWSESGGIYSVKFPTVDGHPLYEVLKAPAKVRFLNDTILLEFGEIVLAYTTGL